jgi:hypothetical protein
MKAREPRHSLPVVDESTILVIGERIDRWKKKKEQKKK